MNCPKCGTHHSADSNYCPRCGEHLAADIGSAFEVASSSLASVTGDDERGTTRTYHSLDEMPPDVRAKFEDLMRQCARPRDNAAGKTTELPDGALQHVTQRFSVRIVDASGHEQVHHYDSPDQMPPEVRALLSRAQQTSHETIRLQTGSVTKLDPGSIADVLDGGQRTWGVTAGGGWGAWLWGAAVIGVLIYLGIRAIIAK